MVDVLRGQELLGIVVILKRKAMPVRALTRIGGTHLILNRCDTAIIICTCTSTHHCTSTLISETKGGTVGVISPIGGYIIT